MSTTVLDKQDAALGALAAYRSVAVPVKPGTPVDHWWAVVTGTLSLPVHLRRTAEVLAAWLTEIEEDWQERYGTSKEKFIIPTRALSERANLGRNTAAKHLAELSQLGFLQLSNDGGGEWGEANRYRLSVPDWAADNRGTMAVLDPGHPVFCTQGYASGFYSLNAIVQAPGTVKEIAERTGQTEKAVGKHATTLIKAGFIYRERKVLYPAEDLDTRLNGTARNDGYQDLVKKREAASQADRDCYKDYLEQATAAKKKGL